MSRKNFKTEIPTKKRWQKILTGLAIPVGVILLVLLIVFIVNTVQSRNYDDTDSEEYTTSVSEKMLEFMGGEDEFVEGKIESTPINLSNSNLNQFENFLSDVQPEYEYSDLYNIDEALKRYNEKNITKVNKHKYDIRISGEFDPDYLYDLVLKNNEAYIKENDFSDGMFDVPKKKEIKELCKWICKAIPEYKAEYPEIDLDTICCNLYDLKILSPASSFANAFIDENNVFNWDKKQMELNDFAMDTEDVYKTTFYHEMVHACQICCDCYNNGNEWRVGIGNDYLDTGNNTLSWYWLTEASAEKIESDYLNVNYSTYEMYIGYLTTLDYIVQLDENVGANMVERVNFNHDMELIFKMFDINTEEERLEFIKMMYSIEVLEMEPDSFYNSYNTKYNVDLYSDEKSEEEFRLNLKDDALISMTKLFYRNLARQINSGNTTLQDMYYLIRVWENKLCYHFSNNEYGYMVAFKDCYNNYLDIQNEFFKLIANDNDITVNEIEKGFENYSINIQDGSQKKSPNCDLKFFNNSEKQFMKDFIIEYYWTGRPNIKECVDLANQCEEEMKASS